MINLCFLGFGIPIIEHVSLRGLHKETTTVYLFCGQLGLTPVGDGSQGGTSGTDRSLASRATREFWRILAHIISLLVV